MFAICAGNSLELSGGRVDCENFEECGKLDFDGPLYMFDIILEHVCICLAYRIVASNRGADPEKAITQVHTSFVQEIFMYVQNDLQTALLAAPAEYEALRKKYGQYMLIPERYATWMREY